METGHRTAPDTLVPLLRVNRATAIEEATSILPYAHLGYTGGYGFTRAELRNAVLRGDYEMADRYASDLFLESVEEALAEGYADNREEAFRALLVHSHEMGYIE